MFENPFKKASSPSSAEKEYNPDPETLKLVMAKAREIAPDAPERDIEAASIRAMHAMEGKEKEITEGNLDENLIAKAIKVQSETPVAGHVIDESTWQVVRGVNSMNEARNVIQQERDAA